MQQDFCLDIYSDFACFSRPELSVERFSYPCPTPSAIRGVFDAIYVKPDQFRWQPTRVEILSPVSYISLRRNEVKDVVNEDAVKKWIAGSSRPEPIWADADRQFTGSDERGRTQRQTMALREVHYRFHAYIEPWSGADQKSLECQFIRRAMHGKCFQQPYLGAREFVAYFRLITEGPLQPEPVRFDQDVGLMLYDVFDLCRPGRPGIERPSISFFRAQIRGGVVNIPAYGSRDVLKSVPEGIT